MNHTGSTHNGSVGHHKIYLATPTFLGLQHVPNDAGLVMRTFACRGDGAPLCYLDARSLWQ